MRSSVTSAVFCFVACLFVEFKSITVNCYVPSQNSRTFVAGHGRCSSHVRQGLGRCISNLRRAISNDHDIAGRPFGPLDSELIESVQGRHENSPLAIEETSEYYLRFAGVGRLYANSSSEQYPRDHQHLIILDRLSRATVAVVGIGGVGSWAAEAVCRNGVGNIVLIDMDDICISNTNRQVHALSANVGKRKIDEMKARLHHINPQCNVTTIFDFVSTENVEGIIQSLIPDLTVCLDAIDGKIEKAALIAACATRQIPIVTVGGSAGKTDPTKVICVDLARAKEDRLLFACRKILRQDYGFKKANLRNPTRPAKKWNIIAVHSTERRKSVSEEDATNGSSFRICDSSLGTACHVTGTFGFVAASCIVDMIANDSLMKPTAI